MINQGMIMAAGYGKRLLPITATLPKPMVKINGISLLEHSILRFLNAGINKIAINIHYMADQLERHIDSILLKHQLNDKVRVLISHEKELLDTGGGVKKILSFFENKPFFIANSDSLWEGAQNIFLELEQIFTRYQAYQTLLVTNKSKAIGYRMGQGDFTLIDDKLFIKKENDLAFIGLQLINPIIIEEYNDDKFSLSKIFNNLSSKGELYGCNFWGDWLHVGDPEAVEAANIYYHNLLLEKKSLY